EEVDVLLGELGRHRAEMQQRQQMADAQTLNAVEKLLAHGLRTADDDEAAVEEILRLQLRQVDRGARIELQALHHRVVFETARDRLIVRRRIEQLVEEILRMLR